MPPTTDPTQTDATLTIGLAQLQVEAGAEERTLERALEAIAEAATRGVDLVALPELFTVGYFAFDQYDASAEPLEGETLTRLQEAADAHDVRFLRVPSSKTRGDRERSNASLRRPREHCCAL